MVTVRSPGQPGAEYQGIDMGSYIEFDSIVPLFPDDEIVVDGQEEKIVRIVMTPSFTRVWSYAPRTQAL